MLIVAHEAAVVVHSGAPTPVAQAGLLPIAPLFLLPFAIVFFVVVFPIWGVALGVLGLLFLVLRGLVWLTNRANIHSLDGAPAKVHRALRWVLTFGGFTERGKASGTTPTR